MPFHNRSPGLLKWLKVTSLKGVQLFLNVISLCLWHLFFSVKYILKHFMPWQNKGTSVIWALTAQKQNQAKTLKQNSLALGPHSSQCQTLSTQSLGGKQKNPKPQIQRTLWKFSPSQKTYCVGLHIGHHGAVAADCACNIPLQLSEPAWTASLLLQLLLLPLRLREYKQ